MEVIIDGEAYAPVSEMPARSIGIGVTTRNRWGTLQQTIAKLRLHTPDAYIVVVDDASSDAEAWRTLDLDTIDLAVRNEENLGIAASKNRCLEELAKRGFDHIFLFDDDGYPISDDWADRYIESPEPHLMYQFEDLAGPTKLRDITKLYDDGTHVSYSGPRGVMLYIDARVVLPRVGGMDTVYGRWGYEHGDWSNRIHNAGLTTHRFADLVGSERWIHSMDEHEEVERGTQRAERTEAVRRNVKLYHERWDSSEYRPFREDRAVVTTLLNGGGDPQRPRAKGLVGADLAVLKDSVTKHVGLPLRALSDAGISDAEVCTMGVTSPYIQRWISYLEWLRVNDWVRLVWFVDGTDVELLRNPFDLEPGKLYIGSEPTTVGSGWLWKNARVRELTLEHGEHQLLNAGLVGGHRDVVMEFIHAIVKAYFDDQIALSHKKVPHALTDQVNDMGLLNVVALRPEWRERLVFGPAVNTEFKSEKPNSWSRFRHK